MASGMSEVLSSSSTQTLNTSIVFARGLLRKYSKHNDVVLVMAAVEALIERLQAIGEGADSSQGTKMMFDREAASAVVDELIALQAIYGDDRIALLATRRSTNGAMTSNVVERDASEESIRALIEQWSPMDPIRLAISIEIDEEPELVRLSAVLPPGYPFKSHPPQLQILNRYVGPHSVDHTLFGQVVRIFMGSGGASATTSQATLHTPFTPGQVALFDGTEKARELINIWLGERSTAHDEKVSTKSGEKANEEETDEDEGEFLARSDMSAQEESAPIESDTKLYAAEPIIERKSTFQGYAAILHDPSDVERILARLLQDRRISRATHPAIFAWSVRTSDGVLHRDCDDDGETAAGGRLAHLLDLLRLENVIVIVTRWYGGVLLGPDRFKLINRAARDALELAGLIQNTTNTTTTSEHQNGKQSQKTRKH